MKYDEQQIRKRPWIIIGGGGHCGVILDILQTLNAEIIGICDNGMPAGKSIHGEFENLGSDTVLHQFENKHAFVCNAIGHTPRGSARFEAQTVIDNLGFICPPIAHPSAMVSARASLSNGVQIMANATVQANSKVGRFSILNTASVVEHDCIVGSSVHICPGAVICGGTHINDRSFIGANATVSNGLVIGDHAIVQAGVFCDQNLEPREEIRLNQTSKIVL